MYGAKRSRGARAAPAAVSDPRRSAVALDRGMMSVFTYHAWGEIGDGEISECVKEREAAENAFMLTRERFSSVRKWLLCFEIVTYL